METKQFNVHKNNFTSLKTLATDFFHVNVCVCVCGVTIISQYEWNSASHFLSHSNLRACVSLAQLKERRKKRTLKKKSNHQWSYVRRSNNRVDHFHSTPIRTLSSHSVWFIVLDFFVVAVVVLTHNEFGEKETQTLITYKYYFVLSFSLILCVRVTLASFCTHSHSLYMKAVVNLRAYFNSVVYCYQCWCLRRNKKNKLWIDSIVYFGND